LPGEVASGRQNLTALRDCFEITRKPIYRCKYTSLSSFWQVGCSALQLLMRMAEQLSQTAGCDDLMLFSS
jgi:hypothetical protein